MLFRNCFLLIAFICFAFIQSSIQDCKVLKQKFDMMCKSEPHNKEELIKKAKKCYPEILPPDSDPSMKEYFLNKCSDIDYCDPVARKKCGPDAFNSMEDNQKEAAMKFVEKYREQFPKLCIKGMECMGFK